MAGKLVLTMAFVVSREIDSRTRPEGGLNGRRNAEKRGPNDRGQTSRDASRADEPGHGLAEADVLLDEEDSSDKRHPGDVHQAEHGEQRHQRPAASKAVKTV